MPVSKAERVASGCLLAVLVVLCGGVASGLLLSGLFLTRPEDRSFVLGLVLPASLVIVLIPFGAIALSRYGRSRGPSVEILRRLAERFGGSVELPTFRTAAAAPRVDATVRGVPVEIRALRQSHRLPSYLVATAFETEHARLGARFIVPTAKLHVQLLRPMPLQLVFATRTRLGAFGASLLGATEVPIADPDSARRFVLVSDRPEPVGRRYHQDPGFRGGLVDLVQKNPPYACSVTVGPSGIHWIAVLSADLTADTVAQVVEQLVALADTLDPRR